MLWSPKTHTSLLPGFNEHSMTSNSAENVILRMVDNILYNGKVRQFLPMLKHFVAASLELPLCLKPWMTVDKQYSSEMQISGLPMTQILHGINFPFSFSLLLMILFECWLNYDHATPYLNIYTHARMHTHTRTYTIAHTHITFLTHSHTQYKSDHMLIRFFYIFSWGVIPISPLWSRWVPPPI